MCKNCCRSAGTPARARSGRDARAPVPAVATALAVLLVAAIGASPEVGATAAAAAPALRVQARPSPGCDAGVADVAEQDVPFTADGEAGAYTEESPSPVRPGVALPLVVDLHAYEEPGQVQVVLSGLGGYGMSQGFATVTPWITGRPLPRWQSVAGSSDLAWIGDLLTHLEAAGCVDENRVFVAGYSNGAFMASLIACHDASRVAAVATVAGIQAESPCRRSRPVPVVAFHGTADPAMHYDGSPSRVAKGFPAFDGNGTITNQEAAQFGTRGIFSRGPSIPDEAAAWARRNGCSATVSTMRFARDVTLLSWACPHRADVELYRIQGGGHTWPGSHYSVAISSLLGATTFSISADRVMWTFFRSHPLTSKD